jgi:predicted Zn-dependent peptidase
MKVMIQITLNIPDNELGFFMKLIEKFNYEPLINDFSINQEMKNVLDERRATSSNEDYVSWEEVKKQIHFKTK